MRQLSPVMESAVMRPSCSFLNAVLIGDTDVLMRRLKSLETIATSVMTSLHAFVI
jgi:hypothetical protein